MDEASVPSPEPTAARPAWPAYAELHCLTNFTFLRGASQPAELVKRAHELGYAALAITDECSVAGVVRAHVAAKEVGLPLIVGSEFALRDGPRCVLLATDRAGYGELVGLITRGRRAAPKGSYRLTRADFESQPLEHCLALWLPPPGRRGRGEPRAAPGCTPAQDGDAAALAADGRWLRELFGERAWLAVELLKTGHDRDRLAELTALATATGLPCVAAGDVHMHVRERRRLQDVLTAIRLGVPLDAAGYALHPNGERHLRTRARLARLYPPELLAATLAVAERCTFSLDVLRYEYPDELVPEGHTPTTWLRELTLRGLRDRFPDGAPAAVTTLVEKELALVAELGYEPFFLTVHDLVSFARSRGILCQGRGSAANSAVCYVLRITEVDPSRMNLLFERFVSKERNEPPDIDVDFEHERREEVIQYLYAKYGRHRAAIAATVITYHPRSAIRDVGKALGLDGLQVDRMARAMQWWDGSRIDEARIREAGLDPASPVLARCIGLVRELMGFPRHLSQHVGGFVIARRDLAELVPVENAAMEDRTVIQWDKDDLDDLGLLKVDVLALGMLTAIRRALDLAGRWRGAPLTMDRIPPEDRATYEMISRADTVGVFQIESRAQMAMLPRLRPRNYYDLVIEVAIIRPGPIQGDMVHPYLRRRNKLEPVTYPSDEVKGVLERTLGVPIFQEQVMQLAIVAAGFSPGEADRLRRAMAAWKRRGGLGPFEDRLIQGMRDRGYSDEFARGIFNQILGFGEYGFPECVVGSTRVVDADAGRWVRVDDVHAGRFSLVHTYACDASLRVRRRRVLEVRASGVKPVYRLRTSRGHSIVASAEHPFLRRDGWAELRRLQRGDELATASHVPLAAGATAGDENMTDGDVARASAAAVVVATPCEGAAILWDTVVSIEPLGPEPTYDLSIEGDHNFLAENLVVHNSHSASFALLVYVSAWLKRHEPAAFAAALLNSQPMGFYAPAQLVRDAREHGVEVRPVDVGCSDWDCTLEAPSVEQPGGEGAPDALRGPLRASAPAAGMQTAGADVGAARRSTAPPARTATGQGQTPAAANEPGPALRLGLRLVRGLPETAGRRIVAARASRPFDGVQDLAERAQLDRRELGALAAAGALAGLAGHRHRAAWEVTGVLEPTPLFESPRVAEGTPLLAAPAEGQDIVADYRSLGLTLGRHPVALLRPKLDAAGIATAARLHELPHGTRARSAGLVLLRQRPGSASGVTFVTLEDETGVVNLVVWKRVAERWRRALLESRLMEAVGTVQREGDVLHLVVNRLVDRSRLLGGLTTRSRDFH